MNIMMYQKRKIQIKSNLMNKQQEIINRELLIKSQLFICNMSTEIKKRIWNKLLLAQFVYQILKNIKLVPYYIACIYFIINVFKNG